MFSITLYSSDNCYFTERYYLLLLIVPVQATNYISLMLEQYHLKEIAVEWRSFGMQLGINLFELKAFDQERITPRQCMEELLTIWIQHRGRDATMSAIIKACKLVGDSELAKMLADNHDVKRIMCRSEL